MTEPAIEAIGLVKAFRKERAAVDGIDLSVPPGCIYGVLGSNGAGKTTTLRMLLGIIDPDAGTRRLLGARRPLSVARQVGYLPEERGLYPTMRARDAIAFMGALRGLPLREGRARAEEMLAAHDLSHAASMPIRTLSKGMAQTVQLIGALVHRPRLVVLDEPFSGLDALNQERLERLIRAQAEAGMTVLFSTHIMAHAERLCERVAIIARGRVHFEGLVSEARAMLPQRVRLGVRQAGGIWRDALPAQAEYRSGLWHFDVPDEGIEPLLGRLIAGGAGIDTLSIERPGLHDAFIAIVGKAA